MGESINYNSFPESDVLDNHIIQRLQKGLYTHMLVTGLPGTGKSSFGCRRAEVLFEKIHGYKGFTSEDIVDSLLGLLERIQKIKKPGEIILIEEVSVLFPSRRSMTSDNVAIGRVLDTCRKRQVILISNAPLFTSIDSHMRAMSHILVETLRVVKSQKVVVAKTWRLQTNPFSGKTYRHRFQRNGREIALVYSKQSNMEIWNQYEMKKDAFLTTLYSRLKSKAIKSEEKLNKESGIKPPVSMSDKIMPSELDAYTACELNKMTRARYAELKGLTPGRISQLIKRFKQKSNISMEK
jgi:hypothetical protein